MRYESRQVGTLVIIALGSALALTGVLTLVLPPEERDATIIMVVSLILALCLWQLSTLTVEVDEKKVRCWFGPGWIRRTIAVADIAASRAVRNRWYYGWGIRKIPKGWMFNISGLDAVELELRSGRRFRIGTDEPEALDAAVQHALAG